MSVTCGTVTVSEEADEGGQQPGDGDAPQIPGIGPLTADNPRALAAGGVAAALVLSRL